MSPSRKYCNAGFPALFPVVFLGLPEVFRLSSSTSPAASFARNRWKPAESARQEPCQRFALTSHASTIALPAANPMLGLATKTSRFFNFFFLFHPPVFSSNHFHFTCLRNRSSPSAGSMRFFLDLFNFSRFSLSISATPPPLSKSSVCRTCVDLHLYSLFA